MQLANIWRVLNYLGSMESFNGVKVRLVKARSLCDWLA
jgi:hypothetical protein